MKYLLDASAALAPLLNEAGAARVIEVADEAGITSVNLGEVVTRLVRLGHSDETINETLEAQGLPVVAIDEVDGRSAGLLEKFTRTAGLSLGDRICLAAARRHGLIAVSADRSWAAIAETAGVQLELIR